MDKLGRYRIEARIGEGAMADVFRAHDPDIGRIVAIKALKPDYRRDPELGARFLREARAAGALNHPNIATIYDVGEADGVPYIAMELIDGRPLDMVLQAQGRMPFERVLALGAQLADALAWAHAQGVVHRDVKPSNILLSSDGKTAKLLDFGVARIAESDGQLARTQAGQMIGTPRYMSPEQALGLPVDARSDLFSLGAVLYEMVTGKTAFDASGLATLALQIAQEKVSPIERSAADCPPGLRQIVEKLLAKKPDQRFADGAQLLQALRRETSALSAEDAVARRGLSLRVKLPLALVSITLIALLLSISAILTRQQRALEHMAIASGETIATFVTKNAAVLLADNAGLPPEQQDWAPLQAFVTAASQDGGVRGIVVMDAGGTIRAASDGRRVGQRYASHSGEPRLSAAGELVVTNAADGKGGALRFVRPIRYAGADFGSVDILLPRTSLDAAMANARTLMIVLASIIMLVVLAIGYMSGAMVVRPLRRLQQSFDEAREQGFALRISHRRRDEIGALFDGFNRLAAEIEPRLHGKPAEAPALDATCIQIAPKRAA
ncbi:protein kinase [Sphingomonas sp. DG1-23]|uniref:serine/threonine-protein kinase n=1 Tax=Sphingomonas sp. DG1-23 TaxID=3068316 RepID=UPI0027401CBF|nr:serine/threonine-protein kinase [Sphingomonas sp. DG1-23]MDP5278855.1 protein kinase [Sphingomonas sp. DG1-23]